eukprot:SAG11_NODE_12991_length_675_cov_1.284722_1_plen_60_part_10
MLGPRLSRAGLALGWAALGWAALGWRSCRVPGCRHEFCWLCGADYENGRHFGRPGGPSPH